jgi:hypothetical protein
MRRRRTLPRNCWPILAAQDMRNPNSVASAIPGGLGKPSRICSIIKIRDGGMVKVGAMRAGLLCWDKKGFDMAIKRTTRGKREVVE